jgi:hypothetical protein
MIKNFSVHRWQAEGGNSPKVFFKEVITDVLPSSRRAIRVGLFVALFLQPWKALTAEPEVIVDLRSPRTEIRKVLLSHTPLETTASDVAKFITKHLPHSPDGGVAVTDGPAPKIGNQKPRGSKFIRIYLGQYYDHPEVVFFAVPMLAQREVTAFWIFDEKARLIDVVVDKQTGVY